MIKKGQHFVSEMTMKDFVLNAPDCDRYTYFCAHYGHQYQRQTAVLCVEHDFSISVRELHTLIRQRINEVLGEETPSCFHIVALASPDPIPCGAAS